MTSWAAVHQPSLSITISWSLPKFMSIELVIPSNHLFLCCPLLLLPSIFSSIRIFSNELAVHIRWPKYWSFSISPSVLISFRTNWLDLLTVQGTLKHLPQHCSSKTSILWKSDFLIVPVSHLSEDDIELNHLESSLYFFEPQRFPSHGRHIRMVWESRVISIIRKTDQEVLLLLFSFLHYTPLLEIP